ncbi:hypothetical protein [Moraxella lacunata]|nr:hypothetical protein [Moraxella lacunata]
MMSLVLLVAEFLALRPFAKAKAYCSSSPSSSMMIQKLCQTYKP